MSSRVETIGGEALERWIGAARERGLLEAGLDAGGWAGRPGVEELLYPQSVRRAGPALAAALKLPGGRAVGLFAEQKSHLPGGFEGLARDLPGGLAGLFCSFTHENAGALRALLPYTAPSPLGDRDVTFGVGDRLGVAGAGHLRVMRRYQAYPVLAQQSVRELELTGRSYPEVLDASTWAVFQEGYEDGWGADGDHLKTEEWVRTAMKIGFTMVTADVSDFIRAQQAESSQAAVLSAYAGLPQSYRKRIEDNYLHMTLELDTGESVAFSHAELARVALVYGEAIEQAARLYRAGAEVCGEGGFDFELSVDETATPTTLQAHVFVALEAKEAGIRIGSLAPRFVGEFQKGIDYIGELSRFESTFRSHAAVARKLGYRISVHSGSDKFSVFPVIGRDSRGRFHIKTAGTNWLEAMKVIAGREPALYRSMHAAALERFSKATKYYHVTTNLDNVPPLDSLSDAELPGLFDNRDARQLIHITYGELLRDPAIAGPFFQALERHIDAYWAALERHIGRHLETLGVPKRS